MLLTDDVAVSHEEKTKIIVKLFDVPFVEDLRDDLREIIDTYLLNEDDPNYRDQRYSSFLWIDSILKDIQAYKFNFNQKEAQS
jgi:hypothetical protein